MVSMGNPQLSDTEVRERVTRRLATKADGPIRRPDPTAAVVRQATVRRR
jgi:hypothetical protein